MDVVRANAGTQDPPDFVEWIARNYAESAAIAVRRLTDGPKDKRSVSVVRLLHEIRSHPKLLSRDWFRRSHRARRQPSAWGDDLLNRMIGQNARSLHGRWCQGQSRRLAAATRSLRRFVDKAIAHRDRRGLLGRLPTFDELHKAMDEIDRVLMSVNVVLTGEGLISAYAVPLGLWRRVFEKPWLAPNRREQPPHRPCYREDPGDRPAAIP
jgi:hypothetical protein